MRLSRTPSIAVMAPTATIELAPGMPKVLAATTNGATSARAASASASGPMVAMPTAPTADVEHCRGDQ